MSRCSICEAEHYARSYCKRHYAQWLRSGRQSTLDVNLSASPGREWLAASMPTLGASDECELWPFRLSGQGYATVQIDRRNRQVMHLVLEAFGHPRPPAPRDHCLHSCDTRGCINPRHLRWGSHQENMREAAERERMARGVDNAQAKLTPDEVRTIRRRLRAGELKAGIARSYRVDGRCITAIERGETWAWVA